MTPRSTATSRPATSCRVTARPPVVRSLTTDGTFSPNGDDTADTATISGRLSESADWVLRVRDDAGALLYSKSGTGSTVSGVWDGKDESGAVVPEGSYAVSLSATDDWKNGPTTASASLVIDVTPSQLKDLTPAADTVGWFSPNGDGYRDTTTLKATNSETGSFIVRVRDSANTLLRKYSVPSGTGPTNIVVGRRGRRAAPWCRTGSTSCASRRSTRTGTPAPRPNAPVNVIAALKSVKRSPSRSSSHRTWTRWPRRRPCPSS